MQMFWEALWATENDSPWIYDAISVKTRRNKQNHLVEYKKILSLIEKKYGFFYSKEYLKE